MRLCDQKVSRQYIKLHATETHQVIINRTDNDSVTFTKHSLKHQHITCGVCLESETDYLEVRKCAFILRLWIYFALNQELLCEQTDSTQNNIMFRNVVI